MPTGNSRFAGNSRSAGNARSAKPKRRELPTKEELLAFIKEQPGRIAKRDIAKAFGIKGADRAELRRVLGELAEAGDIEGSGRRFRDNDPAKPPSVTLLEATEVDRMGELRAKPVRWEADSPPPVILVAPPRKGEPALGPGDRFLGRLAPVEGEERPTYSAKLIKKLGRGRQRLLGVYRDTGRGGRIESVDKRGADDLLVERGGEGGARDGELVAAELVPGGGRYGLKKVRVIERLGAPDAPKAISLIAIHEQGIPVDFAPEAEEEAAAAAAIESLDGRLDLRDRPFVTIDPADARDHDDAVLAEADTAEDNPGGWVVWVAIADVAAFVRPGTALDRAARTRGNSAYFPDRVVPMLPDALSGDLCSLHEGVDRPVLAVRMRLAPGGAKKDHAFHRAMIRSAASLTYEQAQAAHDGAPDAVSEALLDSVISPLFSAYGVASEARAHRSPLELELPERRVELDEAGAVTAVTFRERFDAHRLIEEFMILANVCAAESLESVRAPLLYRVHEEPAPEKIDALRDILASIAVPLAKGQVLSPKLLNRALDAAAGGEHAELVNLAVLRAQTQAYYGPENFGHFGLALPRYAHFTSPIRRYADLIVHRGLISGLRLGPNPKADGLSDGCREGLRATGEHISMTERRAATAERDTADRYLAAWLADRRGAEFEGRVSSVHRFGAFVKLKDSGADGLLPIRALGDEFFHLDESAGRLVGERTGSEVRVGGDISVRLVEASEVTGGLLFELAGAPLRRAEDGPSGIPMRRRRGGGGGESPAVSARRAVRGKVKKAAAARKTRRARAQKKPR